MAFYYAARLTGGLHSAENAESEDAGRQQELRWMMKAAQAGHAKAAHELGSTYAMGREVPQDFTIAAQYYRYANSLGFDPKARFEMLSHPMTIARYKAKMLAKSEKVLPDLGFGSQPYANLLKHSNYIAGEQYE